MHLIALSILVTVSILGRAESLALSTGDTSDLVLRDVSSCTASAVVPPPRGYLCGASGKLNQPALLQSASAPTLDDCVISCKGYNAGQCISFSYNSKAKTCELFTRTLIQQKFQRAQNGTAYYNRHCFTVKNCACTQPQPSDTQFVYNGGFDCGLDSWQAVALDQSSKLSVAAPVSGSDGPFFQAINTGAPESGEQASLTQQIYAYADNDYQLGFRLLFSGNDQEVAFYINEGSLGTARASDGELNTWRSAYSSDEYEFPSNGLYNLTFFLSGMSAGQDHIYLDGISFYYTG